jgi:hypothetical protein
MLMTLSGWFLGLALFTGAHAMDPPKTEKAILGGDSDCSGVRRAGLPSTAISGSV